MKKNIQQAHKPHDEKLPVAQYSVESHESSSFTLSADETASLLFMIEEEKMARDVYDALFEITGIKTFDVISDSENQHYTKLLELAGKFNLELGALPSEAGLFVNKEIQSLYDQLVLQGSSSQEAAADVGILIEQTDIKDLQNLLAAVDVKPIGIVYENLLQASASHLSTFEALM